jgi:hypothetical protein
MPHAALGIEPLVYILGRHQISVPYRRPYVKEVYVRHVLEILAQIDEGFPPKTRGNDE